MTGDHRPRRLLTVIHALQDWASWASWRIATLTADLAAARAEHAALRTELETVRVAFGNAGVNINK